MAMRRGTIWLIVGDRGCGKTTFCQRVVATAQQMDVSVHGLICPARFENGQKVGIDVRDLGSGEQRPLGWRHDLKPSLPLASSLIAVGEWRLDSSALEWGNQILLRAVPCDILIVDEMGILEFEHGKGWQVAFGVLDSGAYHLAVVTVRSSLHSAALNCWRIDREISLIETNSAQVTQQEIESALM